MASTVNPGAACSRARWVAGCHGPRGRAPLPGPARPAVSSAVAFPAALPRPRVGLAVRRLPPDDRQPRAVGAGQRGVPALGNQRLAVALAARGAPGADLLALAAALTGVEAVSVLGPRHASSLRAARPTIRLPST